MAEMTNKILKPGKPGTVTTLQAPGKPIGATSLKLTSSANWPTETAVIFSLVEYNSSTGKRIDETYSVYKGILNGVDITSLELLEGVDRLYPPGDGARAMITVSTAYFESLVDGINQSLELDGSLKHDAFRVKLLNGLDINTTITPDRYGVYYANSSCTNTPSAKNYHITNYPNGAGGVWTKQVAEEHGGGRTSWIRKMSNGSWGAWTKESSVYIKELDVTSTGIKSITDCPFKPSSINFTGSENNDNYLFLMNGTYKEGYHRCFAIHNNGTKNYSRVYNDRINQMRDNNGSITTHMRLDIISLNDNGFTYEVKASDPDYKVVAEMRR